MDRDASSWRDAIRRCKEVPQLVQRHKATTCRATGAESSNRDRDTRGSFPPAQQLTPQKFVLQVPDSSTTTTAATGPNAGAPGQLDSQNKLKRTLTLFDLVGFGLGCTIGAGIFVSLGVAAKLTGVKSVFLSFVVAALGCLGSGLSYAEMATRIPTAGSAYSYVYAVFGEYAAFQTGGLIVLGNIVSTAAVARSFTNYLKRLLVDTLLEAPSSAPRSSYVAPGGSQRTTSPTMVGQTTGTPAITSKSSKNFVEHYPWLFDHPVSTTDGYDTGLSLSLISCLLILILGVINLKGVPAAFNGVVQIFNIGIVFFFICAGALLCFTHPLVDSTGSTSAGREAVVPTTSTMNVGGRPTTSGSIPSATPASSSYHNFNLPASAARYREDKNESRSKGTNKNSGESDRVEGSMLPKEKPMPKSPKDLPGRKLRKLLLGRGPAKINSRREQSASSAPLQPSATRKISSSTRETAKPQPEEEPFLKNGFRGVLRGASLVFFAFLGFDMVTTLAEEAINPNRVIPNAIVLTIFVSCTLYVSVSLVFASMVQTNENVDTKAPLAHAFRLRGAPQVITSVISVGALGNTLSTVLACIVANPRILYRMAEDGLIPGKFGLRSGGANGDSNTDENEGTVPRFAVIFSTVIAAVFGGFLEFELLADFVSLGALVGFTLVAAGAVELRFRFERTRIVDDSNAAALMAVGDHRSRSATGTRRGFSPSSTSKTTELELVTAVGAASPKQDGTGGAVSMEEQALPGGGVQDLSRTGEAAADISSGCDGDSDFETVTAEESLGTNPDTCIPSLLAIITGGLLLSHAYYVMKNNKGASNLFVFCAGFVILLLGVVVLVYKWHFCTVSTRIEQDRSRDDSSSLLSTSEQLEKSSSSSPYYMSGKNGTAHHQPDAPSIIGRSTNPLYQTPPTTRQKLEHKIRTQRIKQEEELQTKFRIPFMPFPALVSILCNCYLICGLPSHALMQGLVFAVLASILFFSYSRHHSKLAMSRRNQSTPATTTGEALEGFGRSRDGATGSGGFLADEDVFVIEENEEDAGEIKARTSPGPHSGSFSTLSTKKKNRTGTPAE
ncbi:unnamed protein product [Amoebophrya sp. A120]|nr:unnamed protein product [Amoebophrya sp. A120]|eukprot:GSA120T00009087001.1